MNDKIIARSVLLVLSFLLTAQTIIYLPIIYGPTSPPALGKGVGMPAQFLHCEDIWNLNVSAFYTWSPVHPPCDRNFIPMIWGGSFTGTVEATNLNVLLYLNEPNARSQANISPEAAAARFQQPGLSSWFVIGGNLLPYQFNPGDATMTEYQWLDRFMATCPDCLDGLGVHYYDWAGCEAGDFSAYLDTFSGYGLPLYITELGCLDAQRTMANRGLWDVCSAETLGCFPFATRIAPEWGVFKPLELVDFGTGELTPLGEAYRGY